MVIINQPNNVTGADGSFNFSWDSNFSKGMAESFDKAQAFIDSECIRSMIPYTPMNTGTLMRSVKLGTKIGSGTLKYQSPYARYQYYGEVYGTNIPIFEKGNPEPVAFFSRKNERKHPTGRPLKYSTRVHAQAGKMWFERMKADHAKEIAAGAAKILGGISK